MHTVETRATYGDMLKYVYNDTLIQATPQHSVALQKLKMKSATTDWGGKSLTMPVLYNSMGSVCSYGAGDVLPFSMPGNYDLSVIPMYWHVFSSSVDGQVIASSKNKAHAFAQAWGMELRVKQRSFAQHMSRMLVGDGLAILAQMDGAIASQVATIDNAGGWSGFNSSDSNGHKFISVNQYLQARNSGGTVHGVGVYISGYTKGAFPSTSATLTLVGTVSAWADGDYLYNSTGTSTTDAYGHECPGLKLCIDDGTIADSFQSISQNSYPEWTAQVNYGSTVGTAEALTTVRMMNLQSDIEIEGGGTTDWILTSPAVWLTYGQLADSQNQIMNAGTYDTAFKPLNFNGIEVWQDPYCPDEMFFVDNKSIQLYQGVEPGFIDAGGGIISQRKGASAAYWDFEAYWVWGVTMGVTDRGKNGKLCDISVTANKF